jgi:hypothetical protein
VRKKGGGGIRNNNEAYGHMKLICMFMRVTDMMGFSVTKSKFLNECHGCYGDENWKGRGIWVVARGFVVRICEPVSRIEVPSSLLCQHVTSQRPLESEVLN